VRAIEQYTHAHGAPQSLDDLVPKYLSAVPHTKSRKYSDFVYYTDSSDEGWSLEIDALDETWQSLDAPYEPSTYRFDVSEKRVEGRVASHVSAVNPGFNFKNSSLHR
jgi:hypothetical protein